MQNDKIGMIVIENSLLKVIIVISQISACMHNYTVSEKNTSTNYITSCSIRGKSFTFNTNSKSTIQ